MKATGIVRRIEACVIIYPRSKTVENQGFPLILSNHINTKICKSRFCPVSRPALTSTEYKALFRGSFRVSKEGFFHITLSTHFSLYRR